MRQLGRISWALLLCGGLSARLGAEVRTDGSVGPALSIPGPAMQIGQELGTRVGDNLFHSFSQFNLNAHESATFTGDHSIQNVISRVTGGSASILDGTLRSTIGNANVYFINPAGIVFGDHAQVDVPAAFYSSTANELQFADGKRFNASLPQDSQLSIAAPAAFGFNANPSGTLRIESDALVFKPNSHAEFNAKNIIIDGAQLGGVNMDLGLTGDTADAQAGSKGIVQIKDSALGVSGNGAGHLFISSGTIALLRSALAGQNTGSSNPLYSSTLELQGQDISVQNSLLDSSSLGQGAGGTIKLTASGQLDVLQGSAISSYAADLGKAGNIAVQATNLRIDGLEQASNTWIATGSVKAAQGRGGDINVNVAQNLELVNGGQLYTLSNTAADAGNLTVHAGSVLIDSQHSRLENTGIKSLSTSDGNAGNIDLSVADKLAVYNGGLIASTTAGVGNAGDIRVSSGDVTLVGQAGPDRSSGIVTLAKDTSSGNAGDITLNAANLQLLNGGVIDASSSNTGRNGNISITTSGAMLLNGQRNTTVTGIIDNNFQGRTGDTQSSGSTRINAGGQIDILNGASVEIGVTNGRQGGDLQINSAKSIVVDGQNNTQSPTAISSDSYGSAAGGRLFINAKEDVLVLSGGNISTEAVSSGDAGEIYITARNMLIDTLSSRFSSKVLSNATSLSQGGAAGHISLEVQNNLSIRNYGEVAAYTRGTGNAGNILINTGGNIDITRGGIIYSNTYAAGRAGVIQVHAGGDMLLQGQQLPNDKTGVFNDAADYASGSAGNSRIQVAGDLTLLDGAKIRSGAYSDTANGGSLQLDIGKSLTIGSGSYIDASTYGAGTAGDITIHALQDILINGLGNFAFTGIYSDALAGSGNAGSIKVLAQRDIALLHGGQIATDTGAGGNAGSIQVGALQHILLDGALSDMSTQIASNSTHESTGAVGNVAVYAGRQLKLINGARLTIFSEAELIQPDAFRPNLLSVTAPDLQLREASYISAIALGNVDASNVKIEATTLSLVDKEFNAGRNSFIATGAQGGNGGSIDINARDSIQLHNSQLLSSVNRDQNQNNLYNLNAGNIHLQTDVLVLNNGFIRANTNVPDSRGGNIRFDINSLVSSRGPEALIRGGDIITIRPDLNVIQAFGSVPGSLPNTPLELNIVNGLAGLSTPTLVNERISYDPCASGQRNSLKHLGFGGAPAFNLGLDGLSIERLLPAKTASTPPLAGVAQEKQLLELCTKPHWQAQAVARGL